MLGFLFGFNARLGRLNYFLATIGLAVVMTAICFVIASSIYRHGPGGKLSPADLMGWPMIAAMVLFGCASFTLQSMRIRDIGWDPVCVIPAWIAILVVDHLVAGKVHAWALDQDHHGTIIGALVNLVLFLALTFWPSGDYEGPRSGETPSRPDMPPRTTRPTSVAAERIARAAGPGFGKRAF
jgi:uncharacterized membrane protein YhaH (DUF805 family)